MTQFHKNNIDEEWADLAYEYRHIFIDPSPEVLNLYNLYKDKEFKDFPNTLEECCNLRYGFECPIEWKGIIREFCEEINECMIRARLAGDDFQYFSFILKAKFGTCRDQGTIFGADKAKYYDEYHKISERLYEKSIDIQPSVILRRKQAGSHS
jgi:hypothetical protein